MTDKDDEKRTAYRIETERLVLRCWSPADAPKTRAALDECNEHLRPWIPFMKDEPRSLYATASWLASHRAAFDTRKYFRYAVFDRDEEALLGENMLLTRVGPGALEIGYWTHLNAIGKGIAMEATCAMIKVAFEVEKVKRLEIMCEPENKASASIPAKLGFTLDATLPRRANDSEGRICDLMVWSLFDDAYPASPAAALPIKAYDCLGELVL
jgi:RimJ/RimL family protein N-acetyltransferase